MQPNENQKIDIRIYKYGDIWDNKLLLHLPIIKFKIYVTYLQCNMKNKIQFLQCKKIKMLTTVEWLQTNIMLWHLNTP